jgi:hypothetical protein
MRWPILVGKVRFQPTTGSWEKWKQSVADHCEGRCVYCAIPEGRFGGIRNFHIEHFRPKAKFPALENDIQNLYLACCICNVLKCDDWPDEPSMDHSIASYPDPAATDFNRLFVSSQETHELNSQTAAGKYLIERVLLNRVQLLVERRLSAVRRFFSEFRTWADEAVETMTQQELKDVVKLLCMIGSIETNVDIARLYDDTGTKKLVTSKAAKKH